MANEITMNISFSFTKGGATVTRNPGQSQVTVAGTKYLSHVQEIPFAAAEDLVQGEVGTPGYILAHNLDATNYVDIGHDETGTFVADVRIQAGKWAVFQSAQASPQAKANAAAVLLEYIMIEA